MSRSVKAACGAVLLSVVTMSAPVEARPPGYLMKCTPGPTMVAQVRHETDSNSRIFSTIVDVSFAAAPDAANSRTPPPGTCAWLDRPMAAGEPMRLWTRGDGAGITWRLTQSGATVTGNVGGNGQIVGDMARGVSGTATFQVMAQSVNGVLEVTGVYLTP